MRCLTDEEARILIEEDCPTPTTPTTPEARDESPEIEPHLIPLYDRLEAQGLLRSQVFDDWSYDIWQFYSTTERGRLAVHCWRAAKTLQLGRTLVG